MIDAGTTMMLVGAVIQALPPIGAIVEHIRGRPNAAELARALPAMPVPAVDPSLEAMMDQAGAALDARG